MRELTCLAIFIIVSLVFAILTIAAVFVFQYKKNTTAKNTTYECGIQPLMEADVKFDVKYFNYAILFLIFDVETIFLYPFAVSINKLGLFAIAETFAFILILLLGLFVIIKKKMLRWL